MGAELKVWEAVEGMRDSSHWPLLTCSLLLTLMH